MTYERKALENANRTAISDALVQIKLIRTVFIESQDDSRVANVSDVDASATNEGDAGRGSRGARQAARRAGPRFCNKHKHD
jgi:hypothetical protein